MTISKDFRDGYGEAIYDVLALIGRYDRENGEGSVSMKLKDKIRDYYDKREEEFENEQVSS